MDLPPFPSVWIRPVAGIGAVVYALAGLASTMPAMMSAMLFDSPGSERKVILWVLVAALLALPLIFAGATVTLGLSAWKRWRIPTLVALGVPVLHVIAIAALFALLPLADTPSATN